jgi:nucleotide-binding universal stress UspA family protein
MYEILLAVDEDDARAIAQAEAVTEMPLDPDEVSITIHHDFQDNPEGASVSQVRAVRQARSHLEEAGYDPALTESSGDPATKILDQATEVDADLIVLAGRKHSPAGKALFGSVTQDVVLGTDRSVLIASAED